MKGSQPLRKSVLSFDNQSSSQRGISPSPPLSGDQEFPRHPMGDSFSNAHFSRIPSGSNINIENEFDMDANISISRQTPPLIGGGFHAASGSMDFVQLSTPTTTGINQKGNIGILGSIMGLFGLKGTIPPSEPRSNAPLSYEPVIDEIPLLEGMRTLKITSDLTF